MKQSCYNCRYFVKKGGPASTQGQCAINPPTVIHFAHGRASPDMVCGWPIIDQRDWCGKWLEKPAEIRTDLPDDDWDDDPGGKAAV